MAIHGVGKSEVAFGAFVGRHGRGGDFELGSAFLALVVHELLWQSGVGLEHG